mmetsp:Transcript_39375/g.104424  ORF Transcript_39375/g.104424 Transcript_39375/m.104424 type:complete len:116 (+) Transcript_39375:1131-1478(+)
MGVPLLWSDIWAPPWSSKVPRVVAQVGVERFGEALLAAELVAGLEYQALADCCSDFERLLLGVQEERPSCAHAKELQTSPKDWKVSQSSSQDCLLLGVGEERPSSAHAKELQPSP